MHDHEELARTLAARAPRVVLDEIMDEELKGERAFSAFLGVFQDDASDEDGVVEAAGPDLLMEWIEDDAARRAPKLARLVRCYRAAGEDVDFEWTPIARRLIDMEPLVDGVLDELEMRLRTGAWSGSTARRHERQRALMTGLAAHANPVVRAWALATAEKIERWIVREREWEREGDERFE
jgi:hypothetical protein